MAAARAAKQAGVQLFLPSEYGISTEGHTGDSLVRCQKLPAQVGHNRLQPIQILSLVVSVAQIQALGLPTARIMVRYFLKGLIMTESEDREGWLFHGIHSFPVIRR